MSVRLLASLFLIVVSLISSLNAKEEKKTTLKELLVCEETWIKVRMDDVKKAGSNQESLKKFSLEPDVNAIMYGGTVKKFYRTWNNKSNGIAILLDSKFEDAKKNIEAEQNISFDTCKTNKDGNKLCTIQASQSKEIRLMETKEGTMFGCGYPYGVEAYINLYSKMNVKGNSAEETFSNLLTCNETWTDVHKDISKSEQFNEKLELEFQKEPNSYVSKGNMQLFGGKIISFFPNSVGQASGVSILIDTNFDKVKKILESTENINLSKCRESKYSGKFCEKKMPNSRSLVLSEMKISKDKTATIVGCYYGWSR